MPYKKVDITGEGTEVVDGGRGTPVDVVQEPTNELEKADTRFISSDKAPQKTVIDSDLQVLGKYYDKDGNELTRSELGDAITADEIDSESATSGKVLTADGDGGASWENVVLPPEVEANPTVPEGTTPTALTGLKVDDDYYGITAGLSNPISEDLQIARNDTDPNDSYKSYKIYFADGSNGTPAYIYSNYHYIGGSWKQELILFSNDYVYLGGSSISANGYTGILSATTLSAGWLELRFASTFTPATTGTITKQQADEYVKLILSGRLCNVNGLCLAVKEYRTNAVEGENYLVLGASQHTNSIDIEECISCKVNAGGTLNITYETM